MDHLQAGAGNPASSKLDVLTPLRIVRLMNAEDARVIAAVASQSQAIAQAIEIITEQLRAGGRLVYAGAGTSGRLGVLDAAECPPTFNSPPGQVVGIIAGGLKALTQAVEGAEDHPAFAERDLEAIHLSSRDVLVGIATSGRTPYVLGAVAYAKKQGAYTIGLACNPDSDLGASVDLAITPVVGPEVLSGSTRLKAGTATKLVLNTLTTGAMVCLGKTFGNLMVDLRATNSKLRARTNRIIRILTGISVDEATGLLERCNGELKTALVVQKISATPEEARERLQAVGGQVRLALGQVASTLARSPHVAAGNLVLGLDGGGSHTVAILARREGQGSPSARPAWTLLGRGVGGPSNPKAAGSTKVFQALDEAVAGAFTAAGLPRTRVRSACLGLAGAARPEDQRLIDGWAEQVELADRVEVTTDAALLLAAGTPEGWGLAAVAGTGSIAFGCTAGGRTGRAGGWGYLLGDEGSGYALVVAALQAVARAADGRAPATRLTEVLLKRFTLSEPQHLVTAIYGGSWDRAALASLAPHVLEAAERGDVVATEIVEQGTADLAHTIATVTHRLDFRQNAVPLALAGGVLVASESYRLRLLEKLAALGIKPDPVSVIRDPAEGAVLLALRSALAPHGSAADG